MENSYADYPTEGQKRPRKLLKSLSLSICNDFLHRVKDFWFVALTNESVPSSPYDFPDGLEPVVMNSNGTSLWDSAKGHFGIVVYRQLDDILSPSGNYSRTRKYFLPKAGTDGSKGKEKILRTRNWNTFSPDIRGILRKRLDGLFKSQLSLWPAPVPE